MAKANAHVQLGCLEDHESSIDAFDFLRLTFVDLNGFTKGSIFSKDNIKRHLKSGFEVYAGALSFGASGEIIAAPSVVNANYGNAVVLPDYSTVLPFPQRHKTKHNIGQVFAEVWWDLENPQEACPRYLLRKQLERLEKLGLKYYSGTEWEFTLLDKSTGKELFPPNLYLNTGMLGELEPWYIDMHDTLEQSTIQVYSAHVEHGSGQFEIPTSPEFGLKAADNDVLFRQIAREVSHRNGYDVTFMTLYSRPEEGVMSSGAHHNFSLWDIDGKKNMFYDEDGQDRLSELARYWIGGILKHGPALCAILCPTTNCYHRLHTPFVPHACDWASDSRITLLRYKIRGSSGTYVENRLPSPLANPYLVMAANIAAGIDGINKKISPPEQNLQETILPKTLDEALDALKSDEALGEILGKEFVEWYCLVKKTDVDAIKEADVPKRESIEKMRYANM